MIVADHIKTIANHLQKGDAMTTKQLDELSQFFADCRFEDTPSIFVQGAITRARAALHRQSKRDKRWLKAWINKIIFELERPPLGN